MKSRSKAQTSLEVLFIASVIIVGLAIILPPYVHNNSETTVLVAVKNAAQNACSYLNTGVVVDDEVHSLLNPLIEENNYTSLGCAVLGIKVTASTDTTMSLVVSVSYHAGIGETQLKNGIKNYLMKELGSINGFSLSGNVLKYGDRTVNIEVVVVK